MRRIAVVLSFIVALSMIMCCSCYAINDQMHTDDSKKIVLTFDDGPHPYQTRQIMDVLDKYGIKATFFVIGQNVEYYPIAFDRIVKSGCEIGNHTYSHRNVGNMSEEELLSELESVSHREYDTGFFFDRPLDDVQYPLRGIYR